jgi:hypothetical protein
MSLFRFPFGGVRRFASKAVSHPPRRRPSTSTRFSNHRLAVERFESRALLAANIVQVTSALPGSTVYGAGNVITFQVEYSESVSVTSSPTAKVNVAKADGSQALAAWTGVSAGGRILTFSYTVQPGDTASNFDVLLGNSPLPGFLIGGTITTVSDGSPADRAVDNVPTIDPTLATLKPGMQVDGIAPPIPTVDPTTYVNPTVWQTGSWATFHPDYFVVKGTIGTARSLVAGEVLTVTVNGATYRATSASPSSAFSVNSSGEWSLRLRPVGGQPADVPVSGSLGPWSTTNGDSYNVIATLTDPSGNSSVDGNSNEIVIDMTGPVVSQVTSTTANGAYKAGDTLDVSVRYSEPVRVMGTPTIQINVSNSVTPGNRFAQFANVDAIDERIVHFSYVIQPNDFTPAGSPLDYVGTTAIVVGSGFIEDQAGNAATNTLTVPPGGPAPVQLSMVGSGKFVVVDTTVPTVATAGVSSTAPDGTYYLGGPVIPITVTFSEAVVVTGMPQIALNSTAAPGRLASFAAGSGTNVLTFNYSVQAGDDTGLLDLDQISATALTLNGGQITDVAGNNAVLAIAAPGATGSLSANKNIVVAAAPTVLQVSSPTPAGTYGAGDTIKIWVMFSKVVNTVLGPAPTLQLGTTSVPLAVATFNGNYVNGAGAVTATPTNIMQFEYLVRPGDSTGGSPLNYAVSGLSAGAGIRFQWAGAALPGFLSADLSTLPAPTNAILNTLPSSNIVIAPDTTAPTAPLLVLTDTTNAIGVSPTDGITSNASITVAGLETKAGTTWQYRYKIGGTSSGTWTPWQAGAGTAFALPANVSYAVGTVEVQQADWSGNASPVGSNSATWTLDTLAPASPTNATIAETGAPGSGITNNPLVTVSGLDAASLLQYNPTYSSVTGTVSNPNAWVSVAGGTSAFAGGAATFSLPVGIYNPASGTGVVVRQQDLAGNAGTTSAFWRQLATASSGGTFIEVTSDVTPAVAPLLALTADTVNAIGNYSTDGVTSNAILAVSGLETAAGTTWQYRYQYTGGLLSGWLTGGAISGTGTSSFTLPTTAALSGTVYPIASVEVRQTDRSGNQSLVASNATPWTIDVNAPVTPTAATITETGTPGSGVTSNPLVTVTGLEVGALLQYNTSFNSGTGAVTGAWVSVPGTGVTGFAGGTRTFSLAQGTYDPAAGTGVVVRQQDIAGNPSPSPWTQLTTNTGGTTVIIRLDTTVATPNVALATDTTPGFAPYAGAPYTTDNYTSNGLVNVSGLEVQNLAATPPVSGIATWEYSTDSGATWTVGGTTAPTGTFTLLNGSGLPGGRVYAAGGIRVRQTDQAGNVSTAWQNPVAWTIDQTAPAIQTISATAGTYTAGQTVTITADFGESIYLSSNAPTLTLNTGATASLVTPVAAGATSLQFRYVVSAGESTTSLQVTGFNLNGALLADKAGNQPAGPLVSTPVPVAPGTVIISAAIQATFSVGSPTAPGPLLGAAVTSIRIVFNTPVTNFRLSSLRLYWNSSRTGTPTRLASLGSRARLTQVNSTTYTLTLPTNVTKAAGAYMLVIDGALTGIRSTLNPTAQMTGQSRTFFRR